MRQEPRCEFELAAQELAPVELGSGLWIGPTLPRCIGGVAPFHPHLSLLLPPGEFGVWGGGGGVLQYFIVIGSWGWGEGMVGGGGVGGGGLWWGLPLAGGGVGNARESSTWKGELHESFQ